MEITKNKTRVTILDGMRVIAILLVMFYHYYYQFLNMHYTYEFEIPEIFKYGYLGVELFFIISGFVITLTLTKTDSFTLFMKKRFIRLVPAMLICSIITFLFINTFDTLNLFENSKSFYNLLISNTFIYLALINKLFSTDLAYIDGAYWSLWVEITFYIIAGLLFFISKKNVLRNFSILVFFGIVGHFVFISKIGENLVVPIIGEYLYHWFREFFRIFRFFEYGLWFLIGMVLKNVYDNKTNHKLLIYFSVLFIFQALLILNFYTISFSIITYILLILFIYKPEFISFLGGKLISKIGIASYSIYLIHQNIGVLIINKLSNLFDAYNWTLALLVIILLSLFGVYSYRYLEVPLGKRWSILFLKKVR